MTKSQTGRMKIFKAAADNKKREAEIRGFVRALITREMGPGSMFEHQIIEITEDMHDDPYVRDMVSDELQKIINLIKEVK